MPDISMYIDIFLCQREGVTGIEVCTQNGHNTAFEPLMGCIAGGLMDLGDTPECLDEWEQIVADLREFADTVELAIEDQRKDFEHED